MRRSSIRSCGSRVQQRLEQNRVERKMSHGVAAPSLLTGLVYDGQGHRMTPTHAVKNGRRYRYYVSRPLITRGRTDARDGWRVPAADLEQLVADRICGFLSSEGEVYHAIEPHLGRGCPARRLIARAGELAAQWEDLSTADRRAVLGALLARIELHQERLDLQLCTIATGRSPRVRSVAPARARGSGGGSRRAAQPIDPGQAQACRARDEDGCSRALARASPTRA